MRDLNETLVFLKVVERGSFIAASSELNLPRSTVSRRVQDLERRLGVQLLHRTTRKLGLTEAGHVYFDLCRGIAENLEQAETAVMQLQGAPRGWLRIGAPPTVANSWIAPLIGRFHAHFPDVRLDMRSIEGLPDIISQELDIALVAGDLPDSTLMTRRLATFQTVVVASPSYIARYGTPSNPAEIDGHRLLALASHRHGGRFAWSLSDGSDTRAMPFDPFLIVNDFAMLQGPLLAGQGLALACEFSMSEHLRSGRVVRVMPDWQGPRIDLRAVFPRGNTQLPKVRVFIDFLIENLRPAHAAPAQRPGVHQIASSKIRVLATRV